MSNTSVRPCFSHSQNCDITHRLFPPTSAEKLRGPPEPQITVCRVGCAAAFSATGSNTDTLQRHYFSFSPFTFFSTDRLARNPGAPVRRFAKATFHQLPGESAYHPFSPTSARFR